MVKFCRKPIQNALICCIVYYAFVGQKISGLDQIKQKNILEELCHVRGFLLSNVMYWENSRYALRLFIQFTV